MQALKLEATEHTPQVTLNKESGTFEFTGRSLTDKALDFYRPIVAWMTEYATSPNPRTEVSFKMEYMNTASAKALFDLFALLQTIPNSKVIWYFQDEDEDMEETGEEFSSLVKIPFDMRAY
jgi:SiaC family regulatory phosphoprotein